MTINFTATDWFKEVCPGAVHVDGTVRAQVVDTDMYFTSAIQIALDKYTKLTGKPAFINTSFNAHGEPIVRTPEEAVTRFLESNIHVLYLCGYRIEHPKMASLPRFNKSDKIRGNTEKIESETGDNFCSPSDD
jgi:carbamoyltransferase